jgi:hypothetical protein
MPHKLNRRRGSARSLLFFIVLLYSLHAWAAEDVWTGVTRIVAVGDVHGDYKQFVTVLRATGVIDRSGKWAGGKTHFVQVGDLVDRGPDSRRVMDLVITLEKQARSAGGFVHALIGNHEAMNLYGDLRYTTAADFDAFRGPNSEMIRKVFWEEHLKELQKSSPGVNVDDAYRKKWETEHPLGFFEHRYEFGPNGTYGKWIRSHNAVVKINDILFLHGGISPKYAATPLRLINERIRGELEDFTMLIGGMVMDQEGPLWYRGMAEDDESGLREHVDAVLANFGVKRIVIGHTPMSGVIFPRFQGEVIAIDVGLSRVYGGPPAGLLVEKGKFYAIHRGTKLELPSGPGADVLAYLKKAAELEPEGSALKKAASIMEAQPAVK